MIANANNVKHAQNLAMMMDKSEIGFVNNSSNVPLFFSSANERMVIAGIRIKNTHGANANNPSRLAYPPLSMLVPKSAYQRKIDVMAKKIPITTTPIMLLKKL